MSLKIKVLLLIIIASSISMGYFYEQNNSIDREEIGIRISNLPKNLKGLRVLQVSDLHLPQSKSYVKKVIENIASGKPDLIFLTGDIVDSSSTIAKSGFEDFIKEITKIAPVYGVCANHETRVGMVKEWKNILTSNGGKFIEGKAETFKWNGESLIIMGMSENSVPSNNNFKGFDENTDKVKLLLSHRPEKYKEYFTFNNGEGVDVVFTGHAHGGQFIIPFINRGLISPNQGLFPKFINGVYEYEGKSMIVSRGLGNSISLPRFNNRVHMPIIILE
ncbi:MAG: metallophosphoesterase [Clostridium sp.]